MTIPEFKKALGVKVFSRVAELRPPTLRTARELVEGTRGRKRVPITRAARLARELAAELTRLGYEKRRAAAAACATRQKSPARRVGFPGLTPLKRARPVRPLSARLETYKRAGLKRHLSALLGDLSGEVTWRMTFVDSVLESQAYTVVSRGEQYSRQCTYHKRDAEIRVRAQQGWTRTVEARGLADVAGLVTLWASPVEGMALQPGEEVYRARWVGKARGFSLRMTSGYLVRRGGEIAHGSTVSAARASLTRRLGVEEGRGRVSELARALHGGDLRGYGSVTVRLGDSTRAGNCRQGTREFVDRYFPGRLSATVAEVLAVAEGTAVHRFAARACAVAVERSERKEGACVAS